MMIKRLLISVFLLVLSFSVMAQSDYLEVIKKKPTTEDIILGVVQLEIPAGNEYDEWEDVNVGRPGFGSKWEYQYQRHVKDINYYTDEQLSVLATNKALYDYGKIYDRIYLKSFQTQAITKHCAYCESKAQRNYYQHYYIVHATIVVDSKIAAAAHLAMSINKALQNITQGSRLAIDQLKVENGSAEEDYKDRIIEVLLDNGYKVVAKEYLERLLKEQKEQTNGIYNDKTTVGTGNFTAVGYYVNVRITDESVRVHIVNVETGEYEGNATEKLK